MLPSCCPLLLFRYTSAAIREALIHSLSSDQKRCERIFFSFVARALFNAFSFYFASRDRFFWLTNIPLATK